MDDLGTNLTLDPDLMALESEIASLEVCFSYSDYNETFHPNEREVDNLQSDMECDSVYVDVDMNSEQEETCKCESGTCRDYSEAQK